MDENSNTWTTARKRIKSKHVFFYTLIFILVPVMTFLIGRWLDRLLLLPAFPSFPFNLLFGFAVFFSGLALGIKSTRTLFKKGQGLPWGDLNVQSQSSRLVTSGPYAYVRNPMTLGYSLLPCGMGLMFQSLGMAVFISLITALVSSFWSKFREERNLERRFGETYVAYKRRTPFLFPKCGSLFGARADRLSSRGGLMPWVFISFSVVGLLLLTLLTYNLNSVVFPLQRQVVGSLFGVICAFGVIAGVRPKLCSETAHFKKERDKSGSEGKTLGHGQSGLSGHHPECEGFSGHVLRLGGRKYCAGCMGLVTGAVMSVVGSLIYFFADVNIAGAGVGLFWVGFVGVLLGLLQYNLFIRWASVHYLLNVCFVVGAFLLLIGISELTSDFALQLYFLALTVFWIFTRIMLSQWEHKRICAKCSVDPCHLVG